jgi:hypothetical protein
VISLTRLPLHNNSQQLKETSMPPAGFELAIPENDRQQNHVLDGVAIGIG